MVLTRSEEVYLMMCAWEWDKYHGNDSLKLCISSYQRPNPNAWKVDAKVTGHYVNSILATSEAKVRGYNDALMLDMNGFVAQAPGANFFMEIDGALYTPPPGHILSGITRQVVINICRELEIPVIERNIKPVELESADGAFLCGTAAEIAAIESIDAKPFRKEWRDSIGATIQEAYKCQVLEKSFSYVII
jgi:branched-chain amino acid aminotransferase